MIELSVQIKLIVFSFIFGFLFSFTLEYFNKLTFKLNSALKVILSFFFILVATFIYFVGIKKIANAIFHIYSILSIVLGFSLYDFIMMAIAKPNDRWYNVYGDSMAKRRMSKALKYRLSLIGTACIFVIIYSFFSLAYNIYTIYDLNKEKNTLNKSYIDLQEQAVELKNDIEKLNNKDYLANYAREKYLYSKKGEYILKLTDDVKEEQNNIDNEINKKYIILFLSFIMMIVFIYILSKGKHKQKK